MAVEVILTMASCWFRIFGSGTCSTRTSFFPIQQFALMAVPFFSGGDQFRCLFWRLGRMHSAMNAGVGVDDLADFHDLLEAPQIIVEHLLHAFSEQLRDGRADNPAGRRVFDLHVDNRAATSAAGLKTDSAGV